MTRQRLIKQASLCGVLSILLCFSHIPASATIWVSYWRGVDSDSYYDPLTIRQDKDEVEVDVLTDFHGVTERPQGVKFMSMTGFERYHCINETFSFVSVYVWEAPMGKGKLVNSQENSKVKDIGIVPGTNAAKLFEILCNRTVLSK
jgi:hypothetical protein